MSGGSAGTAGFVVVLLLCIACFLLFRSMNRHLRRVPRQFDPPPRRPEDPGDAAPRPDRPAR